jgi:hypothetical protein
LAYATRRVVVVQLRKMRVRLPRWAGAKEFIAIRGSSVRKEIFLFPERVAESCACEVASKQFHDKTAGVNGSDTGSKEGV